MGDRAGWIKFRRAWLDDPVIHKDNDTLLVWLYLVANAAIEPTPGMFGGRPIVLQPGQLTTGRRQLSEACGVQEKKVYRVLKLFESGQLIGQQTSNKNSLVSILPAATDQFCGQQDEQQMGSKWAANGQQMGTLEEGRMKSGEYPFVQSDLDFETFWRAYPRKQGKKPARRAFQKADAPIDVLLAAIERQKCSDQWQRENGRFIPLAATWLNQARWEDDVEEGETGNADWF